MHAARHSVVAILLGTLLLAACASLSRPGLERTHYQLQAGHPEVLGDVQPLDMVLAVRTLRVAPGFDVKSFITIKENGEVEADFHHHFFLPPGEMLTGQVRQWLTDAKIFAHVTDLASLKGPDVVLEGFVPVLSRDLSGQSARAVLTVQFLLLRVQGETSNSVLFQKDYRREAVLRDSSAQEAVRGWNEVLRAILFDLERDLRQAFAESPPDQVPEQKET
jgi:cholesterol transport system auxiliary component